MRESFFFRQLFRLVPRSESRKVGKYDLTDFFNLCRSLAHLLKVPFFVPFFSLLPTGLSPQHFVKFFNDYPRTGCKLEKTTLSFHICDQNGRSCFLTASSFFFHMFVLHLLAAFISTTGGLACLLSCLAAWPRSLKGCKALFFLFLQHQRGGERKKEREREREKERKREREREREREEERERRRRRRRYTLQAAVTFSFLTES